MPSMSDSRIRSRLNFMKSNSFLTIQLMSDMAGFPETAGHIIHELKDEKLVVKDHKNWLVSKHLFNDVCV